ncbi:halocyanin domain-containing protein [Halovenus halobia]|uniref:halocyanin domain-containing protein n=1 Tax=Halovenus halobia TaxID=3396622 RepID=UPI003F56D43D
MDEDSSGKLTRRSLLKRGAAGATAGAAAVTATGNAAAQGSLYGGYLSDTGNFESETADATGMSEVTIDVGAGNQGLYFDPAAVVIDPGTTIKWNWTGNGGAHNVYNDDQLSSVEERLFDSGEPVNNSGVQYEFTFESSNTGMHPYACSPHRALGMRGVIVVGADNVQGETYPFGEVEETLNAVAIFGGAAVFGTTALLGLSAYREMFDDDAETDH